MIKLENFEVMGWEHAIRGMRNPMNSWGKGDSGWFSSEDDKGVDYVQYNSHSDPTELYFVGPNDKKLMMQLAAGGPVHAKYRRMITVYVDITAPLYWWKEFDTYKVGTVANSCSTMHKIHAKEFTIDDFSYEHLFKPEDMLPYYERTDISKDNALSAVDVDGNLLYFTPRHLLRMTCDVLNAYRNRFLEIEKELNYYDMDRETAQELRELKKKYWWQMIQLLPSSYNQKRTVMLNYEVLVNIWESRRHHKLDEWYVFCDWIESLPYSELITGGTALPTNEKEVKNNG